MVGENATETWFSSIWKSSRRSRSLDLNKSVIGILSVEVSSLMSKTVKLCQFLHNRQIVRLREDITNSVGIQMLVSEDEGYLMDLALSEINENLGTALNSVAVLGKKCLDPVYHNLDRIFHDSGEIDPKWYGLRYKLKKMEKKVKKMERFVAATEQLCQELEVLAELEQSLKRMRDTRDVGQVKLLEFQQKVVWQRQEVKNLRDTSPWFKTFDYIVRLLLGCLFTVVERIKFVCRVNQIGYVKGTKCHEQMHSDRLIFRSSISDLMQTSVYSSKNNSFSIQLGRSFSSLGLACDRSKSKNRTLYNGPHSSLFCGRSRQQQVTARRFAQIGFPGCVGGSESPIIESYSQSCGSSFRSKGASKCHHLNAPPSTLGYSALALHYANLIVLIEKLASSPHLISLDARNDLYNMLPASIRSCLKARLRKFSRTLASSVFDANFAEEWSSALASILEWLSPLAHNMVRWQSELNYDRRRLVFESNALLVQTLYFANQVKTEAAIVELLFGLNYLFRCSSWDRDVDGYLHTRDHPS